MILLGRGKAKNRKTGEMVYVVSHKGENDKRRPTDWVSYIDSNLEEHEMVRGLNLYWDFEDDTEYEERERDRVYETHLCMFTGMAMQSLMRTKSSEELKETDCIASIAELSVKYSKTLCDELDKLDFEKLMESRPKPKKKK